MVFSVGLAGFSNGTGSIDGQARAAEQAYQLALYGDWTACSCTEQDGLTTVVSESMHQI